VTVQPHQPADLALPAQAPTITGSDMSAGLQVLQEFATGVETAMRAIAPLVYTPSVPAHHWPLPPGVQPRDFPNPTMKHPRETDEDYAHRQRVAIASAASIVLRGVAIGVPPAVALEQMFNIKGKLGMHTKAKYALATSRGVKAWDVERTNERATCAGVHPLTGDTITITVTMDDARRAGWTTNDAYNKTPADMLWSRAMSRVLDRIAGHILYGLASVEELRDLPDEPTPVTAAVSVANLPAPAAPAPAIEQAPAPAVQPEAPAVPEPQVTVVTPEPDPAKLRRLLGERWARLKVTGPGETSRRAVIVGYIVGRRVAAMKDLTADELQMLLDNLTPEAVAQIEAEVNADRDAPEPTPEAEYDPTTEAVWTPSGVDEFAGGQR
jgi:hypothetical protein